MNILPWFDRTLPPRFTDFSVVRKLYAFLSHASSDIEERRLCSAYRTPQWLSLPAGPIISCPCAAPPCSCNVDAHTTVFHHWDLNGSRYISLSPDPLIPTHSLPFPPLSPHQTSAYTVELGLPVSQRQFHSAFGLAFPGGGMMPHPPFDSAYRSVMLDALDLCSVAGFEGWSRWDSTHHHVRSHRFRDLDAARAVEDASLGVGRLRQMDILYLALACCPTIEPIQIALIISSHFPRCSQTVLDPSHRRP